MAPVDTGISSNGATGEPPGRAILLLVDQGNIRFGSARPLMQNALKFVDRMQPNDRLALVAVPAPGELVDFTTDHAKVREAMLRVTGRYTAPARRFNISLTEAYAIYRQIGLAAHLAGDHCASAPVSWAPPTWSAASATSSRRPSEIVGDQRQQTDRSVAAMRAVLKSLGALEGPKSVILVSEGLVLEGLGGEVDDLATVAADVRASLDVLLLDVPTFDATQAQRPTTAREDRRLFEEGLEMLTGMARGTLYRVVADGEFAFRRIELALSGHYLLGVEPGPNDRDGAPPPHRGQDHAARRLAPVAAGVPHSRRPRRRHADRGAVAHAAGAHARRPACRCACPRGPTRSRARARIRLLIAAEIDRGTTESLAYATGLVVATKEGKVIAANAEPRELAAGRGRPGPRRLRRQRDCRPGRIPAARRRRQRGQANRQRRARRAPRGR